MAYYCFLCNEYHHSSPTEEHFIPRSIDGPEHQWLPVCKASNARSNAVFDNEARDILYLVRHQNTGDLKRSGDALLGDGAHKWFKFCYHEDLVPERGAAFRYIFDRDTNAHIPGEHVYAIMFPFGLMPGEREVFRRGAAKMSIGAIAYLLKEYGTKFKTIRRILSQSSVSAIRHFALDLRHRGKTEEVEFSIGRSDVLERLHHSCKDQQVRNHVIQVSFQAGNVIHVEGMLYSQYGWALDLNNQIYLKEREFRLENPISSMDAPQGLIDPTFSRNRICIVNPDFTGQKPSIPDHWRNS